MNRKSLSEKFNRLAVLAALIPLLVGAYLTIENRHALSFGSLIVPALAYVIFLCSLILLVYIFKKQCKSLALQTDQFRQEAQKRTAELNALWKISDQTRDAVPVEDLLKLILDKAMQVVAVRNGSVFLVDPAEAEGLRLVVAKPEVNIRHDDNNQPRKFSFVKSVIESGKTLRIQNIENDPRTMKTNDPKYGSPSFLSLPVYKNKQVIAVMNLANKESGGIFTEGDERIVSIMLGAIGAGIENVSLQNKVKHQQTEIKDLMSRLK